MTDNTVLFDGISELLDPYHNGTQPQILEFESTRGPGGPQITINTSLESGDGLFPEGFTDPDTGAPLTDACFEIGIDDTLDPDTPTVVTSATLETFGGLPLGPFDITNFFPIPGTAG